MNEIWSKIQECSISVLLSVLSTCPERWVYRASNTYTFGAQIILNILAYLDCAYSPTEHLYFACNCQQKGCLVVTHEGTSHPSQRTGRDGIFFIPVSDKGKELCLSSSKVMYGTAQQTLKESRKLKNEGMWKTS